jgi:hypothetical protein
VVVLRNVIFVFLLLTLIEETLLLLPRSIGTEGFRFRLLHWWFLWHDSGGKGSTSFAIKSFLKLLSEMCWEIFDLTLDLLN